MKKILFYIPLLLAIVIFLAGLLVVGHGSFKANNGHLVYTLDDPYIHMAIAKNLALHGVFGPTQYGFSSSSSSPLWTLLLAITYRLTGVCEWPPGAWAVLFALASLHATHSLCHIFGLRAAPRFIICCAVIHFTPLIPLVSTGMEHTMHLFFIIVLLVSAFRFMESPDQRKLTLMCLTGCLATASRYESLFLVVPIAASLILARRRAAAAPLLVASLLPVTIYGVFSIIHGSYFLPNSLMIKGSFPHINNLMSLKESLGGRALTALIKTPHLGTLVILLLTGSYPIRKQNKSFILTALSLACLLLLHLQYASTGWFYRYEAYLVGAFLPVLGYLYLGQNGLFPCLMRIHKYVRTTVLLAFVGFLLLPLNSRAFEAVKDIVPASNHIYRQQYQMGQFLRTMYEPGVSVAANDIGAIAYFADADILDLWGLGTIEVTRAYREKKYNSLAIANLLYTRKTEVVMLYQNCFENSLPSNLVAVCNWSVTNNYFRRTVTFFGTSYHNARVLKQKLRQYQKALPSSINVTYELIE